MAQLPHSAPSEMLAAHSRPTTTSPAAAPRALALQKGSGL